MPNINIPDSLIQFADLARQGRARITGVLSRAVNKTVSDHPVEAFTTGKAFLEAVFAEAGKVVEEEIPRSQEAAEKQAILKELDALGIEELRDIRDRRPGRAPNT